MKDSSISRPAAKKSIVGTANGHYPNFSTLRPHLPGRSFQLSLSVDLREETPEGDVVRDWKVTAAKPARDDLLAPLDLQKIGMTRGWEASRSRPVAGWVWSHLVKTKTPQLVDYELPSSLGE